MTDFRIGPASVPPSVSRQTDDWSCSVRAAYVAYWLLEPRPIEAYAQFAQRLVPSYVDSSVGLKDGSGAGLAEVLRRLGLEAYNVSIVTIAFVASEVRKGNVVLVGGHQWGPAGHWATAVGVEDDGTLILENPAGTYKLGGIPISDRILSSWAKSSWSAVIVSPARDSVLPSVPPVPVGDARDIEIANLRKKVSSLETLVGVSYNRDGEVRKALANITSAVVALDTFLQDNRP